MGLTGHLSTPGAEKRLVPAAKKAQEVYIETIAKKVRGGLRSRTSTVSVETKGGRLDVLVGVATSIAGAPPTPQPYQNMNPATGVYGQNIPGVLGQDLAAQYVSDKVSIATKAEELALRAVADAELEAQRVFQDGIR